MLRQITSVLKNKHKILPIAPVTQIHIQSIKSRGFATHTIYMPEMVSPDMPWYISSINKKPGDTIDKDTDVIIAEYVKCPMGIRSPVNGILKELYVKEGDHPILTGTKLFTVLY